MKITWSFVFCFLLFVAPPHGLGQTDDLAQKSRYAKELMAQGKFVQAISVYRELTRSVPNNPGLILNLGMALHMAGNDDEAIPQLNAVVKLDPSIAPAWLFLGAAHLQKGQASEAVKALKTMLSLQPDHTQAREMLATALLSLDLFEQSAAQYRKLAELDPKNSRAWYGLGQCYELLSRRAFNELQKAAPGSAYWLALVAETRAREQQFSSAFALYRRALEKMPTMRGLHAAVAEIYRQTEHADWADAEQAKELRLPLPDCGVEPLECAFRAGRYQEVIASTKGRNVGAWDYWRSRAYNDLALQSFARLGQLGPSAELHELKARTYLSQKKYFEAANEWREASKLSPDNLDIKKQLAISLKFSQEYSEALAILQGLLPHQPESAELNYLAGDTLLDLQRADEAIPLLTRAVSRAPKLLAAQKSLARADLAAGKAADAIPHLKAALAADEDGSLHYQLAKAYQATGQAELAKQFLAEYQKIKRSDEAAREAMKQETEITAP